MANLHVHFHESDHPRVGSGPHGGEFTAGGSGGAKATAGRSGSTKAQPSWNKAGGGSFTEPEVARLKALRVPPGWTNVSLSDDPNAALQATGRDSKGRQVYRYSAAHAAASAASKFARLKAFNAAAPGIAKKALADMANKSLSPRERDAAAVVALISQTGLRIGSEADTGADVQAFGATTLTGEHVRLAGNLVHMDFIGKKGVHQIKALQSAPLAAYLRDKPRKPGEKIFQVSDAVVRQYFAKAGGTGFKVKDFRTWNGTNLALKTISEMPVPTTPAELKKAKLEVGKVVSAHLGNTPDVALSYYIDPAAFAKWEAPAQGMRATNDAEALPDLARMVEFLETHSYDDESPEGDGESEAEDD